MYDTWAPLIRAALRTPSPHNTQPWRIKIHDSRRATLFMEAARMLPDEDLTGQFLRCAMGLFLESLRLLAANMGMTLQSALPGESQVGSLRKFADLTLEKGAESSPYSAALFQERMTSRLPSNGRSIAPSTTALLKGIASEWGQRYEQLDDPPGIEAIIQENISAVFHDLNVPAYHDEIARWFRYSDEEAGRKADGLDYRCMGVPAVQLKVMRSVPGVMHWPLTKGIVRLAYRRQIGSVKHLGFVSGPFFSDTDSVRAGAFLLHFWLELARQRIYIHPFGNLVTNTQAAERVQGLTGVGRIWLVFRIGYTAPPPQSYRRSFEDVLIHD